MMICKADFEELFPHLFAKTPGDPLETTAKRPAPRRRDGDENRGPETLICDAKNTRFHRNGGISSGPKPSA